MNTKLITTNQIGAVQGDVPILRIDALTPGGQITQKRIVAYGEATGHHHEITGICEVFEVERSLAGQLFRGFEVVVGGPEPAYLIHKSGGEHDPIEMTPGLYFIPASGYQQVEYDGENERRVID